MKHDPEEFARQLKNQEKGMNELTVNEYLKNRERYIAKGRAIEGNAAQKMARQEALKDKIAELRKQGLSRADATKQASDWMDTQAALHNPDQIAGGRVDSIGGLGDSGSEKVENLEKVKLREHILIITEFMGPIE
nr:polymorphic toxin type 15 domain-containing protein [Bacillus sp. AF12]